MNSFIQILIAFLAGGGLQTFITWAIRRKKDQRDEMELILNMLQRDNERLRVDNERLLDMERKVHWLEYKIQLLESSGHSLPVPQWLADEKLTLLSANGAFEQVFLVPNGLASADAIGKPVPKEILETTTTYIERFSDKETLSVKGNINGSLWQIVLYTKHAGPIKVGIGGLAVPIKEIDEWRLKQ